jgi:hypothetical protein
MVLYGHRMSAAYRVAPQPILGGLRHEYRLEEEIA